MFHIQVDAETTAKGIATIVITRMYNAIRCVRTPETIRTQKTAMPMKKMLNAKNHLHEGLQECEVNHTGLDTLYMNDDQMTIVYTVPLYNSFCFVLLKKEE